MVLLVVGFVGLMVVLVVFSYLQAKKRREELAAFAASRGWTYAASDQRLVDRFEGAPFGRGDDRRATNVVYGHHADRPFVAFDYQYETTSGTGEDRRTTTHTYSVVCLALGVTVPSLSVSPENVFGRFFGRLTNSDIELELEDFNRAFTVTSTDRKFASDVLHPQMMEMLLQWPDLAWRLERDSILVFRTGRHAIPEIDGKLAVMDQILAAVPEFVWQSLGGRS